MLQGKTAVVTGAGSGLGAQIARRFAAEGARVVAADRDGGAAERVVAGLTGTGHEAVALDVTDDGAVRRELEALDEIDVLVNSAGVREIRAPLDLGADEWRRVIDVNLSGTFFCSQSAARGMVRRGTGSIVNISSVTGLAGFSMRPAYSASKAGVIGLTRSLGQDLAPHGVRVNAICPGLIVTPLTEAYMADDEFVSNIGKSIPMARPGTTDDIADAALYLGGPLSKYVTGTTLAVDGGFVAAGTFDVSAQGTAFTTDVQG